MREGFNKQLYRDDTWQWTENWEGVGEVLVTRSCQWSGPGCHQGCSVIFYTQGNKLLKVEGDPHSPVNDGRLCIRCLAMPEAVNHPDRIHTPLRRIGERGENKWEEITWDEAYAEIARMAKETTEKYGPKSIATGNGTARNSGWQQSALAYNAFKTPNTGAGFLSGDSCYNPRMMAMAAIFGTTCIADMGQMLGDRFDDPRYRRPDLIVVWGCNPIISNSDGFLGHWVVDVMKLGSKLLVVDPRLTWLAGKAEVWMSLRPGTDGALALAMLNIMIQEGLYDADFVEKWTYGFDALKESVADWTAERAAEITGVPAEKIYAGARLWGTCGVSTLQWGLKLDQNKWGIPAAHAIACMQIITGHIDDPGGFICINSGYVMGDIRDSLARSETDVKEGRIGDDVSGLRRDLASHPQQDKLLEAVETGIPYPIKMLFISSSNTFTNMSADAHRVCNAMKSVDYCVVADLFLTPTAVACADIFIPAAMGCEREGIRGWYAPLRAINKIIDNGGRGDEQVTLELGRLINPEAFPWETVEEMDKYFMDNLSSVNLKLTFEELRDVVLMYEPFEYKKYEKGLLRFDGKPGFNTPTGRIELYSTVYERAGVAPLPFYEEPTESPVSAPELFKEYPLVLSTGRRSWEFFHSEHRQLPSMRMFHPWPRVEVSPEDAEKYGIIDGDWVYLENSHGKCKMKALVTKTQPVGSVMAEHGWWFPEREAAEPTLFGAFESNINCLTVMGDYGPSGYGAPYNTMLCKIYRAED